MTPTPQHGPLLDGLAEPHQRVHAALDDPQQGLLVAVGWAAAHLAAVERVLYPAAARVLPDGRARVRAQRSADRRLQQALWRLDRRLTGDVRLAGTPVDGLAQGVRPPLAAHEAGERVLVERLADALDPDEQQALVRALDAAMEHAPSRPHPDTPHGRLLSRPAYWLDARADRFRDLMDNRLGPLPHQVVPRRRGRWASYLMALPPIPEDPSRAGPPHR